MKLPQLIERLNRHDLDVPMQLNVCTYIPNVRATVEANVSVLIANSGNRRYKPYYDRLVLILNKLENESTITI
jgi:hypothetical protein